MFSLQNLPKMHGDLLRVLVAAHKAAVILSPLQRCSSSSAEASDNRQQPQQQGKKPDSPEKKEGSQKEGATAVRHKAHLSHRMRRAAAR